MSQRALFLLCGLVLFIGPHHVGGAFPLPSGAFAADSASLFVEGAGTYLPRLIQSTPILPANELRALWVVRDALRGPREVERMIDFAHKARFHLIFVQVRGRGDAYYVSATEPPGGDLEFPTTDFDPLEYVLILAHQAGIAVHAWVNTFYVWSDPATPPPPGHVFHEHPDWFLSDPGGTLMSARNVKWWQEDGIEGYYLAPGDRRVRAYLAAVVTELVQNYDVDGIHLDYVRYPGRVYGFDPTGRTDFTLRWGIDPVQLGARRDELTAVIGAEAVSAMDSIYTEWRVAAIDSVVMAIRAAAPGLPLSAAVVPDAPSARYEKGQDWVRWVSRGWMDFVVPMAYNYRPEEARDRTRAIHNAVGRTRVLIGLALHDGRSIFLPQTIAELREENTLGYAIFSYNVLAGMRFPVQLIEEAFFSVDPDSLYFDE